MADDPYDVLGVEPGADIAQIRRVYLNELRRSHPDLYPGDAAAEQRTRDLNRAWAEVSGRHRRGGRTVGQPRTPPRQPPTAYSPDRTMFRVAFTAAMLRVVLAVVAIGLVLLAIQVG